jgi:hypothetical protein
MLDRIINKTKMTMRQIFCLSALLALFVLGCNEQSSVLSPVNPNSNVNNINSLLKSNEIILVSKEIDGTIGGQLTILEEVADSEGRVINIYADLIIPTGAYQGVKTISMAVDWKTASVDFNPSMQFDSSLTFHFNLTNLPLEEMGYKPGDHIEFVYIDEDGLTFPVLSKEVVMNYNKGRLKTHNAKIQHFSRYGFIRKTETPVQNLHHADKSPN